MSGKDDKIKVNVSQLLGSLLGRMQAAASLGLSYGDNNNDRDLYQACGYKKTLFFDDFWNAFKRHPIAKTIIKKVPEAVWGSNPILSELEKYDNETPFEKEYKDLQKRLKINNKLMRLDKLRSLGQYGLLLMGFNDSDDFRIPIIQPNSLELMYIYPYSQSSASISMLNNDKNSERYGLPELYEIKVQGNQAGVMDNITSSESIIVHHSRVIHVVGNMLESDIYGDPELEEIYNCLQDIEKISAGSGEMFWRGARPGYVAKADKDAHMRDIDASALQDQMDEFDHNLRRWLTVQGVDVQQLSPQVVSPKDHVNMLLEFICIAKGIPKRILLGSERGELASSQDMNTWNNVIWGNMINHAEPNILRPLVDRLIEYKIITPPRSGDYIVNWPELSVLGDKDRAEISLIKTKALAEYVKAPGADIIYPPEMFLEKILEIEEEEVRKAMKWAKEHEIDMEEEEMIQREQITPSEEEE